MKAGRQGDVLQLLRRTSGNCQPTSNLEDTHACPTDPRSCTGLVCWSALKRAGSHDCLNTLKPVFNVTSGPAATKTWDAHHQIELQLVYV